MFSYNLESGGRRKRINIQVSQWGCVTNKKYLMKRDAVTDAQFVSAFIVEAVMVYKSFHYIPDDAGMAKYGCY